MGIQNNYDLTDGLCGNNRFIQSDQYSWFPELDQLDVEIRSRSVCNRCPVKLDCAQTALDNREAWGIWGGMEEFRMRRAIGVDSMNRNRIYSRELLCPFCGSSNLNIAKKKGITGYPVQCISCGIHWQSYRIPTKVRKVLKRQHDRNMEKGVDNAGEQE